MIKISHHLQSVYHVPIYSQHQYIIWTIMFSFSYVKYLRYMNGLTSHLHSNSYSEIYLGNLPLQVLPVIMLLCSHNEAWDSQTIWIAEYLLCYSLNSGNKSADFHGQRTLFSIDAYCVIPQLDSCRLQLFTFSCFSVKLQIIMPCKTLISI